MLHGWLLTLSPLAAVPESQPGESGVRVVGRSEQDPPPLYWAVKDTQGQQKAIVYRHWGFTPLPPGRYTLFVKQGEQEVAWSDLAIAPGRVAQIRIASGVSLTGHYEKSRPFFYWKLTHPESGEEVTRVYNRWGFTPVPAGDYALILRSESFNMEIEWSRVSVGQDSTTPVRIDTGLDWNNDPEAEPPPYRWYVYDAKSRKRVAQVADRWGYTPLPPGRYIVTVRKTPDEKEKTMGRLDIDQPGPEERVYGRNWVWFDQYPPDEIPMLRHVFHLYRREYMEEPDMRAVAVNGIRSMLARTDAYSSYVDASTLSELGERKPEQSASTGLILGRAGRLTFVLSVRKGSPATRHGLLERDVIVTVDGRPAEFMSLWEAQRRLDGPPGTEVEIKVTRARHQPRMFRLTREISESSAVKSRLLVDGIASIEFSQLGDSAIAGLKRDVRRFLESGVKALLLDLRGVATGELEAAVEAASLFLPDQTLVMSLQSRDGQEEEFRTAHAGPLGKIPIMILVDRGTSGASEVLAASLQHAGVATSLGFSTDGRGGIQEKVALADGSALFLSTRSVLLSDGRPLGGDEDSAAGVTPTLVWPGRDFRLRFFASNPIDDPDVEVWWELGEEYERAVKEEQLRKALKLLMASLQEEKVG